MSGTMIKSTAMPPQPKNTLQPGATSPMNSAYIASQQQTKAQMNLIGSSKGGAPTVQVPPVSSSAPNPGQTSDNFKSLTQLHKQHKQIQRLIMLKLLKKPRLYRINKNHSIKVEVLKDVVTKDVVIKVEDLGLNGNV